MPDEPRTGRRVARDVVGQLGLRIVNLALGIAVTVLVVRALGDSGFGRWSTILAVLQIVGYLGELGLEAVAVNKAAGRPDEAPRWVGALLTLRLALAVPSSVACVVALLVISEGREMAVAALVLTLGNPIAAVSALRVVFQLRIRNSVIAAAELLNGVLWAGAVLVVFLGDGGLVPLAIGFIAAQALSTALLSVVAWRTLRPVVRGVRPYWRELARVGIPVAISTLLMYSYGRIDQVLVFELAGDRDAGLYGAAYRILDRAQFIPGTVIGTLFPLLAAAYGTDDGRVRQIAQQSIEVILTITLPVLAFSLVAASPTVRALFGEEFAASATAFTILMAVFVLTSVGYLVGYLVLVLDLQRAFITWAVAGLVVNVGLNLLLIPELGFVAAAWATLATELVVIGLGLRATMRGIEHRIALGRATRLVAASAAMALAVLGARAGGAPFALLVLVAAVAYPLALAGARAWRPAELRAAMGRA